jgi:hypothetical protein
MISDPSREAAMGLPELYRRLGEIQAQILMAEMKIKNPQEIPIPMCDNLNCKNVGKPMERIAYDQYQ